MGGFYILILRKNLCEKQQQQKILQSKTDIAKSLNIVCTSGLIDFKHSIFFFSFLYYAE